MATTINSVVKRGRHLSSVPYTGCDTRIVSLVDVGIPEVSTDEEYRALYTRYTQQCPLDDRRSNASLLRDAIESIRYGIAPPVAFPTETVYGLGADATNEPATSGIFAAKGRPSDNPLIVHVASNAHLERVTDAPLPEVYKPVVDKFWPGPLTILLPVPKSGIFAKNVHPAQTTIGFRIPSSKYARFFIAATDKPIAGPSANSSGKPSPTTAQHVLDDLKGKINFVLDGGACEVGVESTVVDGLHNPPLILRPGGVGLEEFRALGRTIGGDVGKLWARTTIGYKIHRTGGEDLPMNGNGSLATPGRTEGRGDSTPASVSDADDSHGVPSYIEDINGAPRAPGMKYRHYAPKGRLILFSEHAVQAGLVADRLDLISNEAQSDSPPSYGKQELPQELKIGIISCHWPAFAGLADMPCAPESLNYSADATAHEAKPEAILSSVYADITTITHLQKGLKHVTLYNVRLGPEISTLAYSLFGVLRLFDELDCGYIFAETVRRNLPTPSDSRTQSLAPSPPAALGFMDGGRKIREDAHHKKSRQARRDLEDAVIDRIEKAAAERVE